MSNLRIFSTYRRCRLLHDFKRNFATRNILKLKDRGMYEGIFPDTAANTVTDLLNSSPQCVYAGFDPTADSLHVGNLLVLLNLLHWHRGGHKTIALIGGATAKIGDPSGKTTERELLNQDTLKGNIQGIRNNIELIYQNHQKYFSANNKHKTHPLILLNNEEWYNELPITKFIGEAGRHLRMGTMLSRTSVQSRLNSPQGMSFTEFSYQLFQAYDWQYLYEKYNCRFQIGGNDQMGNIMSGHELISKACKAQVFALTMPIITSEMGDKFGKSAGNAVWLSAKKTSPFEFYQFWMRTTDSGVEKLLRLFTFESIGSVEDTMRQHREHPERRLPQCHLAEKVTLLVHGEAGLEQAKVASKALYEGSVSALSGLPAEEIVRLFKGTPVVELSAEPGQSVFDLAMSAGCFPTKQDALRIIAAGGFYINQQRCANPAEVLNCGVHRLPNNMSLLRVGKRNYYLVKWI